MQPHPSNLSWPRHPVTLTHHKQGQHCAIPSPISIPSRPPATYPYFSASSLHHQPSKQHHPEHRGPQLQSHPQPQLSQPQAIHPQLPKPPAQTD